MKWVDYLLFAGIVVGACLVLDGVYKRTSEAAIPVAVPSPSGVCKLVAVTPDGTKVYRIEGPEMIVPAVLAVSPDGQVAFR